MGYASFGGGGLTSTISGGSPASSFVSSGLTVSLVSAAALVSYFQPSLSGSVNPVYDAIAQGLVITLRTTAIPQYMVGTGGSWGSQAVMAPLKAKQEYDACFNCDKPYEIAPGGQCPSTHTYQQTYEGNQPHGHCLPKADGMLFCNPSLCVEPNVGNAAALMQDEKLKQVTTASGWHATLRGALYKAAAQYGAPTAVAVMNRTITLVAAELGVPESSLRIAPMFSIWVSDMKAAGLGSVAMSPADAKALADKAAALAKATSTFAATQAASASKAAADSKPLAQQAAKDSNAAAAAAAADQAAKDAAAKTAAADQAAKDAALKLAQAKNTDLPPPVFVAAPPTQGGFAKALPWVAAAGVVGTIAWLATRKKS